MSGADASADADIASADLLERYRRAGKKIATAESCTGGLVAAALTDVAGSSDVVERGFVTYSNEAKTELIGVPADLIARVGAVSAEVAKAMAEGALAHSRADVAVSVTGIAGPGGATPGKPVGLVWFGLAAKGAPTRVEKRNFAGDRAAVRRQAVATALALLARAVAP
jgi:nicotinamide-nucleotide amidase